MYQQEDKTAKKRCPAFFFLGLTMILATLTGVLLFVSISTSFAASNPIAPNPQDGPVITTGFQPTSTISLNVATSADFWPMEYISGTQIVGHDIDLMNSIAAEMGVTAVYTNVAFADIIDGLVDGKYDLIISTLTISPEREEIIDFSLPYVILGGIETIAIGIQQGDDSLRSEVNDTLRQLRADGTLQTIIEAIAADQPDWQPIMPEWPLIFLPFIVQG